MTKSHKNIVHVKSKNPPIVELDSAAHAAYIRFSRDKVEKTLVVSVNHCLVTIDTDKSGDVVGVELLGVTEFGIETLVKKARIQLSQESMRSARYVPANTGLMAV